MCIQAQDCRFKFNNWSTKKRWEICSKLTVKTPERHQWSRFGVFNFNLEHISHLFLVFLLLLWTGISLLELLHYLWYHFKHNLSCCPSSFNPFHAVGSFLYPLEIIRKLLVFLCFQGLSKATSCSGSVRYLDLTVSIKSNLFTKISH